MSTKKLGTDGNALIDEGASRSSCDSDGDLVMEPFTEGSSQGGLSVTYDHDDGLEKACQRQTYRRNRYAVLLRALTWLKRLAEIGLVGGALWILFQQHRGLRPVEAGDDMWGVLPKLPHEEITFSDQVEMFTPNFSSAEQSLEVLQRWRSLIPSGSGNIDVGELDQYGENIPAPYKIKGFGDAYKVAWVHQMQCLTIMCHADMTMEGASGIGPPRDTDGLSSTHICRKRDVAIEWMESHRLFDTQELLEN
ncbi:hypothetical protein DHEL01_v209110 [Diaporthe helianthi]|uniref:Uncharacterized protein n=1 Tax=Diaporthe helianthi TaxID=158607 RepID=A0A2P5HQF2_DIAHE|nr:hypothetical protein DHEL01_v209110 [Diaporthe helianthi]